MIWTDHDRLAAVTKVANNWASARGASVQVVQKQFGNIRNDLGTVAGRQRARRHRRRARLDRRARGQRPRRAAVPEQGDEEAVPELRARRVLVRHRGQAPLRHADRGREHRPDREHEARQGPEDCARRSSRRRSRSSTRRRATSRIAVQQGANGDAYHMYPFFSGLCGYVFGHNSAGNLDPRNIGVANAKFLKNAPLIDKWNKEGLINSKVDYGDREERVPEEAGRLLDHRPVEHRTRSRQAGSSSRSCQLPKIKCQLGAVPRRPGLHGHEVRATARRRDGWRRTWSATT